MEALRTCPFCGFENAEESHACPLCGGSAVADPTLTAEALVATTLVAADRSAPSSKLVGRSLGGRYEVLSELGRGGMGRVFRVRDLATGRAAALKVMHPVDASDPRPLERFRREIEVLLRLRHPAIPAIQDWGSDGGEIYFVSELVEGVDLKTRIQEIGPSPLDEACRVAATVAEALHAAHDLGIVHRDVKPSNIMQATDGSVRLLDFGLARGVGIDLASLTRTGVVVGTPSYMSPEQLEGQDVDRTTDIYSLGVVLFELLTGRLPFVAPTAVALAMKHKLEAPPLPRSLRADLPRWVERVVLTCLAKEPGRRFQSSAALAAELRRTRIRPTTRKLPTGDLALEDDTGAAEWELVLASTGEKHGWSPGMALRIGERYYKLVEILPPAGAQRRWRYCLEVWPDGEVFRRLVDYERDSAESPAVKSSLSERLGGWLKGRRE